MEETRLHRLGVIVRADVLPTLVLGFVIVFGSGKAAEDRVPPARSLDAAAYALLVLAAATVPLRRHAPTAMLGTSALVVATYLVIGYPHGPVIFTVAVAACAVAITHSARRAASAVIPASILLPVASDIGGRELILGAGGDWLDWLAAAAGSGLVLVPAVIGVLVRRSRTYAERAKEEETRRKVEQERLRVAREVHDVVGHSLSIISLQAGVALHVLDRRPEQAQVALEAIRRTSLDALDELRATLALTRAGTRPDISDSPDAVSGRPARSRSAPPGHSLAGDGLDHASGGGEGTGGGDVLGTVGPATAARLSPTGLARLDGADDGSSRNDDGGDDDDVPGMTGGPRAAVRVPLTGLARLEGLLGEVRLCGVPVDLVTTGSPGALPADVDLAAYRVVQESLTNVMRHAAPARASVSLGYEPDRLTIDVVDEPFASQAPSGAAAHGPGHGVAGLAAGIVTEPMASRIPSAVSARGPRHGVAGLTVDLAGELFASQVPSGAAAHGPGHGLAGLAERLGELGGSLTAGPWTVRGNAGATCNGNAPYNGGSGWRVHAELPLRKMDT